MEGIVGKYNASLPALGDKDQVQLQVDASGRLLVASGAGTPGAGGGSTQTVQFPEDSAALTKSSITTSGASATLVAASTTRTLVLVCSAPGNAQPVEIDITGGTASATSGVALLPGGTLRVTGKQAQSAMSQFGLTGQVLTVFSGS